MGVEERDRIGDLDDIVSERDAAKKNTVDGGGLVLQSVENQKRRTKNEERRKEKEKESLHKECLEWVLYCLFKRKKLL